jgi:hypothetical protein
MSAIVLAVILRCGSNVKRVYVIGSPRRSIRALAEKRIDLLASRSRLAANKASKDLLIQLLSWYSALDLLGNYTVQVKTRITLRIISIPQNIAAIVVNEPRPQQII